MTEQLITEHQGAALQQDIQPAGGLVARLVRRLVEAEEHEVAEALMSFAMFFAVLSAYYILRPIRDEMGVTLGKDGLQTLFTTVFVVMLALVPVFGWLTTRFARRTIVPIVYGFFIVNLVAFWAAFESVPATSPVATDAGLDAGTALAGVFFVWASVFNLFVVSMFWILMSELFESGQAKRLYGFIAAGGTAGALAGPLLTRELVRLIDTHALLLVSAGLLGLALAAAIALRRMSGARGAAMSDEPPGHHGILAGALRVATSPYLFRIALFIFIANVVGTYFYLEQSRIVGEAIADKGARVHFFATRDLAVSVIVLAVQLLVTGRVLSRFGLAVPLAALPLSAGIGLALLSVMPSLEVVAAVMVAERAIAFSITNPAVKVLYTAVDMEDKYKAQNFIDTVVYRGGDAAAGHVFDGIAKALGLSGSAIALATLPIAGLWLGAGLSLARRHGERTHATTALQ